jgi:hypothetical protein
MHSLVRITKVNAGSEVLTAVAMNNSVFWDIMLKVNRHFGGIYRLHLQGLRIKPKKQRETYSLYDDSSFSLPLNTEDEGDMFLRNISRYSADYATFYPRRENSSDS